MKKNQSSRSGYGNIGHFTVQALEAALTLKSQVSFVVTVQKTNQPNWLSMTW